jgi:hypothetical protein
MHLVQVILVFLILTCPMCSFCMDLEKGGGTAKNATEKLKDFAKEDSAQSSDVKGMAACVRTI